MSNQNSSTEIVPYEQDANSSQERVPEAAASVNKIRDIILGSQIKNYEARFVRLEENLNRETAELKETMRRRFESIEAFFKSESEALAARLKMEREERTSSFSDLERDTKETQQNFSKRLNDIDTTARDGDSGLRKELMTESRKLLDEMTQHHDSIRSLMETRFSELLTQKTDRGLMADLLREMASQLDDEEASPSE